MPVLATTHAGQHLLTLNTFSPSVYIWLHFAAPRTTAHPFQLFNFSLLPSRVTVMRCRPPFVCMYVYNVYMYIRPSQPATPRLCNSPVFSARAHDNKTLYLATISHKMAQHSTSSLRAAFRLLLTSSIAPARATRLLASTPYSIQFNSIIIRVHCTKWC